MISIHKLRHAVVLAKKGRFQRAAAALNLTQPALSRSIKSLETSLGVRLFDRGHGEVEPTTFGRLVVERGREILAAVTELEHEIAARQGLGAGTLEVSLAPYPSALSGQLAVARLLSGHPGIHCRVRVAGISEVADDVVSGRCELGIADLEAASDRGLVAEALVNRPLYFVARPQHPLVRRRCCTVGDVMGYPWATIRAPSRIAVHLPEEVGRAGRWDPSTGEFVPALEVDVVSDFLILARESDILVAATLTMAEEELAAGKLAVVPFQEPWLSLRYGFISRPNRTLSPTTLEFLKITREIETDLDQHEAALREHFL